ncbi:MAG: hypothetical protein WEB52_02475 [Dehalococcoidia bacterium]
MPNEPRYWGIIAPLPADVRERVSAIWQHADSATLSVPAYGLEPAAMLSYMAKVADVFYR